MNLELNIVSGGQTGVDRAALDFALDHGIPCGGFCPKGRLSEDGAISDRYPLTETSSTEYHERTEQNVLGSDGTLIIYSDNLSGGTRYTFEYAKASENPLFLIDLIKPIRKDEFRSWMETYRIETLNIAGPRESQQPGIYQRAIEILAILFEHSV
ncbi:MAG: putative molybdenum carrier protein [Bacteroidales bacterium]|nr:putative molybdenum carrier protein [Bacteroidota bacterium]MBL6950186.1 putative molybdenum carrier protein [Bacteroidales bacterium]